MEIESIAKYISLNKLMNGSVEVVFSGQPCLTISENSIGSVWKINPIFAKLVYGANVFEDIPVCCECYETTEKAISSGLIKLHELGAFNNEIDFPEDSYAQTLNIVRDEVKDWSIKSNSNISEAHVVFLKIMKSIDENTFESRSEYDANMELGKKQPPKRFSLINSDKVKLGTFDSEDQAVSAFKTLHSTKGVKIVRENDEMETSK